MGASKKPENEPTRKEDEGRKWDTPRMTVKQLAANLCYEPKKDRGRYNLMGCHRCLARKPEYEGEYIGCAYGRELVKRQDKTLTKGSRGEPKPETATATERVMTLRIRIEELEKQLDEKERENENLRGIIDRLAPALEKLYRIERSGDMWRLAVRRKEKEA